MSIIILLSFVGFGLARPIIFLFCYSFLLELANQLNYQIR